MNRCPRCDYSDDDASAIEEGLRRICADRGITIGPLDWVKSVDAAVLLQLSPRTLEGWRATHRKLPVRRLPGGRVYHSLADIAALLAAAAK